MSWFQSGDAPVEGPVLRSSLKGGALSDAGMTERAITKRVRFWARRLVYGIVRS